MEANKPHGFPDYLSSIFKIASLGDDDKFAIINL